MGMKGIVASMGLGAAVGAVAVMMMPRSNPARQWAAKAADKVEAAACKCSDKISDAMEKQ